MKSELSIRLLRRTEVVDLIDEARRVVGVRTRTPEGALEVRAALAGELSEFLRVPRLAAAGGKASIRALGV